VKSAPKAGELRATSSLNKPPRKAKGVTSKTVKPAALLICQCGEPEPEFNGYCRKCVTRIAAEYKKVRAWYQPIEEKYEEFDEKINAISGKKILLKRKIERMEQKM